jgi:PTS system nitrogen regulatory IIA component
MLLTIKDAARLLDASERQVYRWVDEGEIPFQRVKDQVRFNRTELLEWATSRRMPIDLESFDSDDAEEPPPSLAAALRVGGVHDHVLAADRDAAIRAVVERTPMPSTLDRELLVEMLLARETTSSTAIGDGIAIPHVRHPVVVAGARAVVGVSYLEQPVAFGAPDGKPVTTIFMIVSPTVRAHLQLLARLARALRDPGFRSALEQRAPARVLIEEAARVERPLTRSSDAEVQAR